MFLMMMTMIMMKNTTNDKINYEDKYKELMYILKIRYNIYTEVVRQYEKQRRNTENEFYKKSYQTTIHKFNARREEIKGILEEYDINE